MTAFDFATAQSAREQNPRLTVFDTGEVLEPHVGPNGVVDFDNDESATVVQVSASPSTTIDETTSVTITEFTGALVEVIVGGRVVWFGDAETGEAVTR